jgi:hypothetical protein
VFGVLAGLVSAVDAFPYVRDIVRRRTRPYRATWAIWTVLGVTEFCAQAGGAGWSLLMLGAQAASVVTVFALSIGRGVGRLGPADRALIAVAAAGLIGWYLCDRPLYATVGVVLADEAGRSLRAAQPGRRRRPGSGAAALPGVLRRRQRLHRPGHHRAAVPPGPGPADWRRSPRTPTQSWAQKVSEYTKVPVIQSSYEDSSATWNVPGG